MKLLAFDTSTESLAVALADGGREWLREEPGGARSSAALLPAVHALLAEAGLALSALDAIAFGRGPGAFTGLRTSCAVAQGLALGLGLPLLPLDSLLLVADDARAQTGADDIAVAVDARMDEAYAGRWRHDGTRWQVLQPPALYTLPALAAAWADAPPCVAGNGLGAFGDRLGLPPGGQRVPAEHSRPAALLRLARAAAHAGEGVDPADALPLYLRDKVALTTAEREARR